MPARRGRNGVVAVAMTAILGSAGGLRAADPDTIPTTDKWNYVGSKVIDQGLERQRVPPERQPSENGKVTTHLDPGAPIWLQSGKTRVIQVPRPIKRVSIG